MAERETGAGARELLSWGDVNMEADEAWNTKHQICSVIQGTASNWQSDVTSCWIRTVIEGKQAGEGNVNARTKDQMTSDSKHLETTQRL